MKINIIRGQNQIGGSIIELATSTTRIILDAGINLGESKTHPFVPSIPGLFIDSGTIHKSGARVPAYDGIFISHYHSDHTGLLPFALPDIPIYMGKRALNITKAVADFKGKELGFSVKSQLKNMVPITVGDIKVTPIFCDHSAYGAFMFLIQTDEGCCNDSSDGGSNTSQYKTILYTGDYRQTGRRNFQKLLNSLPKVDVLITEGTTLSRGEDFHEPSEGELEDLGVELLTSRKGPAFIYLSAQNVDRLKTGYQIAKRTGRRFIMDELSSQVAKAAKLEFSGKSIKKDSFNAPDFLFCVTPQTLSNVIKINRHISFDDGTLFFARREVYMLKPVTAALVSLLKSKGIMVSLLHTSGHGDSATIQQLIETVDPSIIIPVHTENADWFSRFEGKRAVIYDCKDLQV